MNIEIIQVKTKKELDKFIRFPQELYKNHSQYVSELNLSVKSRLTNKNPFLRHSEIALFLAEHDDSIVGRIAAIKNKTHLRYYQDDTGFFGFFDLINNLEVAHALFFTSFNWLKDRGLSKIVGPTNPTTNDSCGILVNGFNYPNMINMPYNYDYYNQLCVQCGFTKAMDLYAYEIDKKPAFYKYGNILERIYQKLKDDKITIRPVSSIYFKKDMAALGKVYNDCNKANWGFIPLKKDEFLEMSKDLKTIMPYDLALLVEKNNEIIGFVIAVPDINQAIKHVKNGKLSILGILKLLWFKRNINKARVMLIGVLDSYRRIGLDLVLYQKITSALLNRNMIAIEACYVLESNTVMNNLLKKIGGNCIKEYRIYRKDISSNYIKEE